MAERPLRHETPAEETWDLEPLYGSREEWLHTLKDIESELSSVTSYQGKIGLSSAVLAEALDARERLLLRLQRADAYASLQMQTDGTSQTHQADVSRAESLVARVRTALTFIETELLAIPAETISDWLKTDAEVRQHQHLIDEWLAQKPYRLLPETETAISQLSVALNAPYRIYGISKSADMTFNPAVDSEGNLHSVYMAYMAGPEVSTDTTLRRNAYASFTNGLKAYRNTYAATLATEIETNIALAKLRGYPSVTHMLLHRHKVSLETYHAILDNVQKELAPHMRRYQRLRQRLLGLDKMLYCDLTVQVPGSVSISFEEAKAWVLDAVKVFGEEYHAYITRAFDERWIDRANNVGKRSGAFCSTIPGVHPYVFLTWGSEVRSAFTLAHELGHAGHLGLASEAQRLSAYRPPMSFIEAPSTMNELVLANDLLSRTTNPGMKQNVISAMMGTYHHNFVNHLLEAEFQRRILADAEAGTPVTESLLSTTKGAVLQEFWGDAVEIDEGAQLLWMRQPHYYMGLYPYTYVLGLTISTAAAAAIRSEGTPAAQRWLSVLKAGGTRSPKELAQMAGVDIDDADVLHRAVGFVGNLVDQLETSYR